MSKRIKGLTIEIAGNTQPLNKALEDVNKKSRDLQGELRQVEKLLKLNPKDVELVAQKQKILSEAVANSKEKLDRLKTAQEQVNEQYRKGEIGEEQYRAFQREVIKAEEELKKLEKQLADVNNKWKDTAESLDKMGKKSVEVGKNLSTKVTAPIVGIGVAATKMGSDFVDALAKVSTLADTTQVSMDDLKVGIMDISNASGVAATEVSESVYSALSAGVETSEVLDFIESNIMLVKAGFTEMGTAIDVTTTVMNAYGEAAYDVTKIGDILVKTQDEGKISVDELGQNLGRVIPTASSLGVNLDQLGASYAIMTAKGQNANIATTNLNSMLGELGKTGSRADEALRQMTDKSFKELVADGETVGDVLGLLSEYAEQAGLSLSDMFGSTTAGSAALTLLSNGVDGFNESVDIMNNSTGTMAENFEKLQTPSEELKKSLNKIKNAMMDIAEVTLPAMAKVAEAIGKVADKLLSMDEKTRNAVVIIAGIAAAIGPALIAFGLMAQGISVAMAALSSLSALLPILGAAIAGISAPVAIVIGAIAALVAAGVALYKNLDQVQAFGKIALEKLKVNALRAVDAILRALEKLFRWVPKMGDAISAASANAHRQLAAETAKMEKAQAAYHKAATGTAGVGGFRLLDRDSRQTGEELKELQSVANETAFSIGDLGSASAGAGSAIAGTGRSAASAASAIKTAWVGTMEDIKNSLSTLKAVHETEMIYAEMAGDNVAILRLKHGQLNTELEKQKVIVEATRKEIEKVTKAGVLQGETKEDLAKRIDTLNLRLAEEEKAQASLEKQIFDANKEIKKQSKDAKDLVKELKDVADAYYNDLGKALEDYRTKVKETNEKLKRDMASLQADFEGRMESIRQAGLESERRVTEQYQQELNNRTRALMNFVGLFDEVTRKQVSGDVLLANLKGQVGAFEDWQENIADLAEKGIDEGLLAELQDMGPKAGAEIAALNTLTDEQLKEYVSLWRKRQEQAKKEATEQLAEQRREMNDQLSDIRRDTQNQLERQRLEMAEKLQQMQEKAKEELEKYKKDWEKKNEEIRKNTEKNIQDIHDKFNDLVGKASGYGISLMDNFMDGIDSMMPALISKLEGIAAMIDSYMPHSPAKRGPLKRIMEWGPALVGSLADGIQKSMPVLEKAVSGMAGKVALGSAQLNLAGVQGTSTNNYGNNTFYITVEGGNSGEQAEELIRELHKRGVRF